MNKVRLPEGGRGLFQIERVYLFVHKANEVNLNGGFLISNIKRVLISEP